MTLHIQALGPGIDLTQPVSDAQRDALLAGLIQHHVLFFENQPVTPVQQRDLARRFGELHIHPVYPTHPDAVEIIVLDTDVNNLPDNDNWHTDVTFIDKPPMGALLSARPLPPSGGDTLWASGIAAYEALSEPLRKLLEARTKLSDLRNKLAGNEKLEDALAEVLSSTEKLKQLSAEALQTEQE